MVVKHLATVASLFLSDLLPAKQKAQYHCRLERYLPQERGLH